MRRREGTKPCNRSSLPGGVNPLFIVKEAEVKAIVLLVHFKDSLRLEMKGESVKKSHKIL